MTERASLLAVCETLTPADHQTHRRYAFVVPEGCERLHIRAAYSPKHLDVPESAVRAAAALGQQSAALATRVGDDLARDWSAALARRAETVRIPNLVTISLDDAAGAYRGAAHRQSAEQSLVITPRNASPGLIAGELAAGAWTLVLSAHTLVSAQCDVSIQIGADVPTSTPRASRCSA